MNKQSKNASKIEYIRYINTLEYICKHKRCGCAINIKKRFDNTEKAFGSPTLSRDNQKDPSDLSTGR